MEIHPTFNIKSDRKAWERVGNEHISIFFPIFSPMLEKKWLEVISSTHSEQLTFISFILSAKELLSKHWLIYKPVRFGLLRWWQSCPITSSGCCRGTHTSVRSWRRVRAAAIAIVSEEMGRKEGERERQRKSISKPACNSKSSCLRGGNDSISQNFSVTFWKCCSISKYATNHVLLIWTTARTYMMNQWAIGKEKNERSEWSSQVTTQNRNTCIFLSYSELLAVLGVTSNH